MAWRLIVDDRPRAGAENMAIDHVLLESVQAGNRPVLRLYRWDPPCLSLGRNQPVPGPGVATSASVLGIDLVRRPTGGMAVFHDRELTYSVAAGVGVLGSPRESYRAINRALVAGLRHLGVAAEIAPERPAWERRVADWATPCFDAAAPGEVVVAGRKLVGSAQRCERRTLLQHGSILLEGDQREAARLLTGARHDGTAAPAVASLASVLGAIPGWDDLVLALGQGFEDALGVRLERDALSAAEEARADELVERYRSDEWTWRR